MKKNYCKWILEILTDFYVFFIILIFPLIIGPKGYQNILEIKYYTYATVSVFYIISIFLTLMYFFIVKKINYFKAIKLKKVHYLVFIFIIMNILSCVFSPYKEYNLFLGLGRGEGLFNILLYSLTFLLISLFFKFDKKYFKFISLSVIFVSLIAFLEYLGFNPFNIYKGHTGPFNMSYMTTFGNKGVLSAFYTIMITISFCSYIFLSNSKIEDFIHLLSIFLGIFIFGVINVDSGLVAFAVSLMLVVPFILINNKYLSKAMIIGGTIVLSYALNYILNPVYRYSTKIYKLEPQFDIYSVMLFIVIILFVFAYFYIRNSNYEIKSTKKFVKRIYIIYPIVIIFGLILIYFVDFNIPLLNSIQEILHGNFSDELGTYRLFLWKRSIKLISDYPLIGTGPDTFSYRFMSVYWKDVLLLDNKITINDTAANVYLTMLVNIGILGLISYLSFIIKLLKDLFSYKDKSFNISLIFFFAIICFLVQDFFNLSVVIITPIFYTIMGIAISCIDTKKEK